MSQSPGLSPHSSHPAMEVSLDLTTLSDSSAKPPSKMVLKVFDRRFALHSRERKKLKPSTYESEDRYHDYVASGCTPEGFDAIWDEREANYEMGIEDDPPNLLEHILATQMHAAFDNECAAYNRLKDLQGQHIPIFYGVSRFLDDSSVPGLDRSVRGILLEVIPGVRLRHVDPTLVNVDILVRSALNIIDLYNERDVLNMLTGLWHCLVKPDHSGVIMIGLSQTRLRGDQEDDKEWMLQKRSEDEEGAIGCNARWKLDWDYVPTYKYGVNREGDDCELTLTCQPSPSTTARSNFERSTDQRPNISSSGLYSDAEERRIGATQSTPTPVGLLHDASLGPLPRRSSLAGRALSLRVGGAPRLRLLPLFGTNSPRLDDEPKALPPSIVSLLSHLTYSYTGSEGGKTGGCPGWDGASVDTEDEGLSAVREEGEETLGELSVFGEEEGEEERPQEGEEQEEGEDEWEGYGIERGQDSPQTITHAPGSTRAPITSPSHATTPHASNLESSNMTSDS
ncbi:hypothetical protein CTheo_7312 [Ceratobasidium theobromae]|uniref:Uncharacterized protein n=1 Tax=Ceratobasidium theobromae TaxID=1582974 RepID=A0A5N5QC48_9AGAM|nr:hypothetical protein CTheo_7312 [Ceratobasidium theobromae]